MKRAIAVALGIQAASIILMMVLPRFQVVVSSMLGVAIIVVLTYTSRDLPKVIHQVVEQQVHVRTNELKTKMSHYEQQAMTDALTGLLNRRGGEESIEQHTARCRRLNTAFSFILLDIDHFKLINDKHGHATGDIVLGNVSRVIKETLRRSDFAVRWGGEEFLICLPDTDLEGAIITAEKLRKAIEKHNLDVQTRVTASLGCAELGDDPFHLALARADMHLYFAKSKGRNKVFPNSVHKVLDVG